MPPSRAVPYISSEDFLQVKDVIAYLQLLDNPAFVPAFLRVINVPSRTIGEKVSRLFRGRDDVRLTRPDSLRYPPTCRKGKQVAPGAFGGYL